MQLELIKQLQHGWWQEQLARLYILRPVASGRKWNPGEMGKPLYLMRVSICFMMAQVLISSTRDPQKTHPNKNE